MAPVCHTVWAWIHRNTLLAHVTDVPYLVFLGQPVQAYVRSADTRTLAVNRTSPCSSFGDRTFAAAGTRVWNSLPPDLRQRELSYGQFRRSLNTFLFGQWDHGTVWTLLTAPSRNILSYLLTYLLTERSAGKIGHTASRLSRSVRIIWTGTDRSATYDFLLVIYSHHRPISCRFRYKRRFWWKVNFFLPRNAPADGIWGSKTAMMPLACHVVKKFWWDVYSFKHNTTTRRTDGRKWYNNIALFMLAHADARKKK